ncbi:hypothetical protein [Streptomyces sp. NPDC093094]|uniref:hypothetical protein n=1 Tax=Streptomyces sp. NPDC093094 TaxID=3366026 RepID=UPI00380B619D
MSAVENTRSDPANSGSAKHKGRLGTVLDVFGAGENTYGIRLLDAETADPIALGQRAGHAARLHPAVPGRPARRPLTDGTEAPWEAERVDDRRLELLREQSATAPHDGGGVVTG